MIRRFGIGGLVRAGLAAAVLLSLIVFAVLLGPSRAGSIAAAAVLNAGIDGFAEDPGPHRIPVLDLRIAPASLDSLQRDLPWSGGENVRAILLDNGIEHKVKFRYRGVYATSHFLGGKKSFRMSMKRSGPLAPYRRVNVINPKAFNMVNDHMAAWVAGTMGVAVPMNEMVFVRMNDEDYGVMEQFEQVDGDFERTRHLTDDEVPVYKGDYPPITGRALTKGRSLWQKAANWQYASNADSTLAHARLASLVAALQRDSLPLEAHRDSLAKLIDVDAFLRYHAALVVINSMHIDQYHNQWLVLNPRTGKFYPVLWDALMIFAPPGEPVYYVHDALEWWMLRVPEWRLQRDRYVRDALVRLEREGGFDARLDEVIDRIQPSVLADRNKFGNVTMEPEDVHRFSVVHVISSLARFRSSVHAHWDRILARLEARKVEVKRGAELSLSTDSEAPLQLEWMGEEAPVMVGADMLLPSCATGRCTLVLHRTLRTAPGGKDHPLADKQHLIVEPLNVVVRFPGGVPASLRVLNAITHEPVE